MYYLMYYLNMNKFVTSSTNINLLNIKQRQTGSPGVLKGLKLLSHHNNRKLLYY